MLEGDHEAVLLFDGFEFGCVDGFRLIFISLVFDILQRPILLCLFLIFFGLLLFQLFRQLLEDLGLGNFFDLSKFIEVVDIQYPFGKELMESSKIKYPHSVLD